VTQAARVQRSVCARVSRGSAQPGRPVQAGRERTGSNTSGRLAALRGRGDRFGQGRPHDGRPAPPLECRQRSRCDLAQANALTSAVG
jgi:hypothetical protein